MGLDGCELCVELMGLLFFEIKATEGKFELALF